MNKIKDFIENKKVLASGIIFLVLSIIANLLSVMIIGQAHIYDIIHAFPTVIIYDPIITSLGGYVASELIFIPLAVIIDFIIGIIVGVILKKFTKTKGSYTIAILVSFVVYWVLITYQWLPIL